MEKYPISIVAWAWLMVCCISSYKIHASTKSPNNTSPSHKISSYHRQDNALAINMIDSCWRTNPNWDSNRHALADCAKGFGSGAIGGKTGDIYVVTNPSDDPVDPKPGTLRYGVIQTQPLWIVFARNMVITLQNVLMLNSYKTIDGRGARVEIANGPCISIDHVHNVIIHGLSIHNCKPGKPGLIRTTPNYVAKTTGGDGDAIHIYASTNVWIDHCYLARGVDGLLDVTDGSNAVTISNNHFTQHDKVMLLGSSDEFLADKNMKVTVVYNYFGPGLVQRQPRVRLGYAHIANNRYDRWEMYAIGGSANPTLLSEGNYFEASNNPNTKQVTKRDTIEPGMKNWNWRTTKDFFLNGAFFSPSGSGTCAPNYFPSQAFTAALGASVPKLTSDAGPLQCVVHQKC